MSIRCGHCGGRHSSVALVRGCSLSDPDADAVTLASRPRRGVNSIDDVERVLGQVAPRFGDLVDAIRVSRGNDRWDLVESVSDMAIAAVTGEVPTKDLAYVARQLVAARIHAATEADIDDRLREVAAEMDSLESDSAELISIAKDLSTELLEVATLLADSSTPSLVAAAARLRKLDRPDLAVVTATRALQLDAGNVAALTVRGAARADQYDVDHGSLKLAMDDAKASEAAKPSKFTANLLARLCIQAKELDAAVDWGEKANERAPGQNAGAGALMKAYALMGDREEAERWAAVALRSFSGNYSEQWIEVLAARELAKGPHRADARESLETLWNERRYPPARKALLELFGEAPA